MAALRKYLFLLLILLPFMMGGCEKDVFKQSCLESRVIMEHAASLLIPSVKKNDDSGQENVMVRNDNSKAIEYLGKNDQKIKRYYNLIKGSIIDSNKNYFDAIYAASYINELYYYLTGNELDDRCNYLGLIEKNKNAKLSDWLINDLFSPIKKGNKYKKNWTDLDFKKKREMILRILTEARKSC